MAKLDVVIQDESGKEVSSVPMGENGIYGTQVNNDYQKVYKSIDDSGKVSYTADPYAGNYSSISLNKETGDIKITAPSTLYKTQTYQEKIKPVLETVSQNYKLNHDYKYALLNDENDTKTSEDWVKEINKELSDWTASALSNQRVKDEVKKETGLELNDEQLIKMSSVALERQADGSVVQVKDDTIQSLPEVIKNLAAFKNLQGWKNGEVTYKDLMESWNRENTPDEDLLQVYDTVSEYFRKGEFDDADEYAEMVAFSQFIEGKHPETGFWRGAWDGISDTFYNIWAGAAKFDTSVLNALEGATDLVVPGEQNFIKDYLMPELEDQVNKFQTNSMRLNEAAGAVGAISYELTPLAMQFALGNALGKAAANGVASAASKLIAKTGEAGLIGAAEGMTAEQVATAALNGTNFLMRVMSSNKANGLVASAVGTLKAAQTLTAVVSTTADLAAQIVVDVTVQDSKLARQLIEGDVSNEVKEYVLEQIALDAGGWAVAAGSIKAVQGVAKTDVGRVTNAAIVPRVNKWASKIGEYTDVIKTSVFHAGDANWNKTKADRLRNRLESEMPEGWKRTRLENKIGAAERRQRNLQIRRTERLARAKVGQLSGPTKEATSWAEVVNNANQIKRESDAYFTAAHALADRVYKNDVAARVTRIKTDVESLGKALDDYTAQLTKVLRMEDLASLRRAGRSMDVGRGKVLSQISKESNEYVLGTYRATLGESAKKVYEKEGKSISGVQQEIDYYTAKTQAFREKYPELAEELDKLREIAKRVSASTEDARVFEKVLEQDELDGRRASEYFENGYIRTQRVQDWENYQKRGGELNINRIRDDQHLNWGFEGDTPREFQDITFVLFDDVNQVAKQSIRKDEIGYLRELGETVEVEVSGEEVRMAKTVNATRAKAVKDIQNTTNNVVKDMDPTTFNRVFEYKEAKSAIMTGEANAIEQGARISRAEVRPPKVTRADRQNFVRDLDTENLDDLILLDQTSPFARAIETEEDFQEFLNTLDNKTKQYLLDIFDGQAGELFSRALSKEEQLAQLPTFDEASWTNATGKKVPAWAKKYVTKEGGQALEDVSQIDELKLAIDRVKSAPEQNQYTLENLNRLIDNDQDLLTNLKRQYVLNNKKILDDPRVTEVITKIKQEQAIFDAETLYAQNIRDLEKLKEELNLPGMATNLNRQMDAIIDDFVATNAKSEATVKALSAMEDSDDIIEYATLKSLTNEDNLKATRKKLESAAESEYNRIITANNKTVNLSDADSKRVENSLKKMQVDAAPSVQRANDVFEARQRVNRIGGKAVPELDRATKMAELELEDAGYLMNDYTGRKWNDGLNVDVVSVEGEEKYIIETVKPAVLKDGKIVQKAQVVVGSEKPKLEKPTGEVIEKLSSSQIEKQAEQWAKQTADWYEERVNQRFGQVTNRLRQANSDIVDYDDLFGKIEAINREITDAGKADDIVKTYDDMGREEYVRLSPTVANLITTMPTPLRRGWFGETQAMFVKVFRMGTTGGLVLQSLIRQWFRDSGLAVISGNVTRPMSEVEETLTKVYGPTIAEYYQQEMPDVWQTLLSRSEETGQSAEQLAVQREMSRARTYTPDQMQSSLYAFNRQARIARNPDGIYDKQVFDGIKGKLERAAQKTEKLNNMRETNRRVWVYNNAYLDALNNGHSVPMARRYAEMIQSEATTNFSRQAYHLANLTHTVPYLGSAINGSKSFWRLMAMDPVGITTRIVGGYVVPLIALTNMSIADPENRAIYKSIPEYEKDDNLVFVLSGQKISIPIPQEISSFVRPIQSWIETMQGANDHSIEELMANNLAGFFPYELQGFVNIDSDRILVNDDFEGVLQNHLLPGFSMLSSQMMGPLVKSGVMWATGYDPYTRKRIDTAYTTTDPETGESVIVDYKAGGLAKLLGNIFQGNFNMSADMAQAVFNNLLGTGNMNIIDGLTDIALSVPSEEGIGSGLTKAAQRFGEAATKPLYIPTYGEQSNQAWKRAVSQLYLEKDAILNDPEYKADIAAVSKAETTEEAKSKALSRIKTKKEEFQEKVLRAAQNLVKNYDGGTIDRYKFASVISLMAFSNGYSNDPTDPLSKRQSKDSYQLAKAKAIETMAQMGFDSPSDGSIFGYYKKNNETGEIAVEFYSPLAILDFEESQKQQSDVALANIQAAVNDAGLWQAHNYIKKQRDAIYSKEKLSNQDYADIDAIYINWNAQVAKTLAPYVNKMTPEAAINNKAVRDYLYSLIEVPGDWEVNNKGRRVTLGDRGNKKAAYYESWIKSMFGINDPYKGQY